MHTSSLDLLVSALNKKLRLQDYSDVSNNGLQVQSQKTAIRHVCSGVDASLEFFEAGLKLGADLFVCHHGISWGDSLKYITGVNYKLLAFLFKHDIALWSCHLPLDADMELGNNAQIASLLCVVPDTLVPFCKYHDQYIGWQGELEKPVSRDALLRLLKKEINPYTELLPFGKRTIRNVGIVSGGAAAEVEQAAQLGLDAYITGEVNLQAYNLAKHLGINLFSAGHYATECFGVRAVGDWLRENFGLEHTFVDLGIKY